MTKNPTRERIIAQLEYSMFEVHKQTLIDKITLIIDRLQPHDYFDRWISGEAEHGEITKEALMEMNLDKELKEEIEDAFWYHVMEYVQDLEKRKGKIPKKKKAKAKG